LKRLKFKEIYLKEKFKHFESDPYFKMVRYLAGAGPDLKKEYVNNEASNILKYQAFKEFQKLLKESGFKKFMPVKGIWLFNNLFREFQGIRTMADVDFLFHASEFAKLPEFINGMSEFKLSSKGSLKLRARFAEEISVIYRKVLIEMHSKITLVSFPGLIEEIFNSSEIENIDGVEVLNPSIESALIIMLLHDYSRADLADLTVARLLEFYIVFGTADVEKLKSTTKRLGLERMLESHLFMIFTMFENTEKLKGLFKVHPEHDLIESSQGKTVFTVSDPVKFQKFIYGKQYKKLFLRNAAAEVFKKIAGKEK